MKILIVLLNFLCVAVMGQVSIRPTITMPSNPPANVAEWNNIRPLMISTMIQQGTPNDIKSDECKMVISIKSDGKPVCGKYTLANAPYYRFSSIVMSINKEEILSHLGECVLKSGQYELCVDFYGFGNRVMGSSCKPFTIADNKPENFTPPSLISPAEGKILSEAEQKQPINFRWTPIVPRPRESVTYRVVVLEVKKGQTATEARNLGNKVYENKVENQTQLTCCPNTVVVWPIAKDSKYAWYVEVLGVKGNLLGSSEVAAFSVAGSADIKIVDFKAICSNEFGKYTFTLKAENPGSSAFNVTGLNITGVTVTSLSPSLPTTINPGSANAVTFTGGFTYSGTTYPAAVYATINGTQLGNTNLTSSDTELDSLVACVCHDCDKLQINLQGASVNPTSNPNLFAASGSINISGLPAVYGIEMQILSYSYSATPSACSNGINSVEQSCVFNKTGTTINGLPVSMMNETVSGLGSTNNGVAKNIKISSSTPLPSSIPINLNIGLPSPITGLAKDCCKMTHNICIKVRIFYDKDSCKSCSYTYCFPSFNN